MWGAPGTGKTALADVVAVDAGRRGFEVLRIAVGSAGADRLPWAQLLRDAGGSPAEARRLLEPVQPLDLAEAVRGLVSSGPRLIVVDELDRAGPEAVEVLALVVSRLAGSVTAVVANSGEHVAAEALAEGQELGDSTAMAYALHALSIQHVHRNDFTGSLRLIDQALPLAGEERQLADLHMLLLLNRQSALMESCRFEEASALARRTLARNELSGSPRLATVQMQAAFTAYEIGSWDVAAAELEAITEVKPNRQDELHAIRALLAGHREEWQEAARHLEALEKATDAYGENRPASHHNHLVLAAWPPGRWRASGQARGEG